MTRLSPALVVCTVLLSTSAVAETQRAKSATCDPAEMNRDSYRLSTDAQALNVTRPRTSWWDGFDASLHTHQDALGGLNEAATGDGHKRKSSQASTPLLAFPVPANGKRKHVRGREGY